MRVTWPLGDYQREWISAAQQCTAISPDAGDAGNHQSGMLCWRPMDPVSSYKHISKVLVFKNATSPPKDGAFWFRTHVCLGCFPCYPLKSTSDSLCEVIAHWVTSLWLSCPIEKSPDLAPTPALRTSWLSRKGKQRTTWPEAGRGEGFKQSIRRWIDGWTFQDSRALIPFLGCGSSNFKGTKMPLEQWRNAWRNQDVLKCCHHDKAYFPSDPLANCWQY